jgi:hypothetical protein
MPKRVINIPGVPLLDIASYARRGPGYRDRLSPAEVQQIARTVRRTPEVMVKVLSRGGQDLGAVRRHLDYLRLRDDGELELETDNGERLSGQGISKELLEDWDLDLEEHRRRPDLDARRNRSPKLVHKLMFSMPAGTPPEKVLAAVKNFAREDFWGQHRYAFVLHTDEAHPHVHLVLKPVSEQGVRLNIKKATLRRWRSEFARNLRVVGVEANATERAVRGENRNTKKDGIFRASQRGDSMHIRNRVEAVAKQPLKDDRSFDLGKARLLDTRSEVEHGWRAVSEILGRQGQPALASQVRQFTDRMASPTTEKEQLAAQVHDRTRDRHIRREPISR